MKEFFTAIRRFLTEYLPDQRSYRQALNLLAQPDTATTAGRRNHVVMILMYGTAARCSKLTGLRIRDLNLDPNRPTVHLHVLRHTRAMHSTGKDSRGHASIESTRIYADIEMEQAAITLGARNQTV